MGCDDGDSSSMSRNTSKSATTWTIWFWVLLPGLCRCSGNVVNRDVGPDEGGAAVGGARPEGGSTGFGGIVGTATGAGGGSPGTADGQVALCLAAYPNTSCVSDCGSSTSNVSAFQCVDGQWQCSSGSVRADQCPADSCAANVRCCDGRTGELHNRTCGMDGRAQECPAGSFPAMGDCVPADAGASQCAQLDGRSCSFVGEKCSSGFRCSTSCDCIEADGGFVWFCSTLLC